MAISDLKLALRSLLRAPGLLVSAVVCLALGIGLNAAMLGVLDLLLLRPPAHVQDAGSLVRLYYIEPRETGTPQSSLSYPMIEDLDGKIDGFSGLAAYFLSDGSLGLGPEARKVRIGFITPRFFHVLGVQPVRGRLLPETKDSPERLDPLALISWELWQHSFGGASDILGKALRIEGQVFTVVGVLPPHFTGVDLEAVEIWLPLAAVGPLGSGEGWSHGRQSFFLNAVGRLRPGVSAAQAAQQATAVHRQVYRELGDHDAGGRSILLRPIQWGKSVYGAGMARLATWLTAGAAAVLLIACANVANLLIVRGLERRRELAMQLVLGASRARLARLLLAEGVMLAFLGGAGAIVVSWLGGRLIRVYLLPPGSPYGTDLRLLVILAALALLAGLLSGLGAAFWGSREEVASAVRIGTHSLRGGSRLRSALLVAQVAFTFMLLAGAALFLHSFQNVRSLALGLEPERVLVATTNLAGAGWTPAETDTHFRRALERVRALPGVERASIALGIPFRSSFGTWISVDGRNDLSGLAPGGIYFNAVSEGFFATLETPLLRGRDFTARDGAGTERVVVINDTMAKRLWPGKDPLGQCFLIAAEAGPCTTVIGVVADARRVALQEPATFQLYVPLSQAPEGMSSRALFVRSSAGVETVAGAVQREMQGLAPNLPFVDVRRLSDLLEPQVRPWKLGSTLFSLFGGVALVLAILGIFATVGRAVASRTHEMGLRMALGARSSHLIWRVMRFGLAPAAAGIALGLGLVLGLGRFFEPLMFQLSPYDPGTLSAVTLILLGAALLASSLPALRVGRLAPSEALRSE